MKFELRDKNREVSTIYLWIRYQKMDRKVNLKYPTRISIPVKFWDDKRQKIIADESIPNREYNVTLTNIENAAEDIFRENAKENLTTELIREKLDLKLGRRAASERLGHTFKDVLENTIREQKEKKKPVQNLQALKLHIPLKMDWRDMTYTWYRKWKKSMERKDLTHNYICNLLNSLKGLYYEALRLGAEPNNDIPLFPTKKVKRRNIYLSDSELMDMYHLELPEFGYLDNARDLFLVGCYTGFRVGDYISLDENINIDMEAKEIRTVMKKGGNFVKVPLHWVIVEIMNKYKEKGGFPRKITPGKLNTYIKEVAKRAGINKVEEFHYIKGGRKIIERKYRYECVTTHTARRSLCTNLYLEGVPLRFIMQLSGHKTETMCMHYIKAGLVEVPTEVADLEYWKKPDVKIRRLEAN